MSTSDLADADLVTLPSSHGVRETVDRLQSLLSQKKIQVFADIDHAAGTEGRAALEADTRVDFR